MELLQRTEDFRIPPITTGSVRRLAHIALPAPDLEAAITFYGTHLGMHADSDDSATFRIGPDALKLHHSWPPARTLINHLALETTTQHPDTHDPDGNRLTFLPVS